MTFSYDPSSPDDVTRVRYHIGDTDEDTAIFSDEEIAFVLDEEDDHIGKTVVSLIQSVMARLAHEPDMTADWLRVDWRRSAENWKALLSEKRRRFQLGAVASAGGQHAWRPDTRQRDEPDYHD